MKKKGFSKLIKMITLGLLVLFFICFLSPLTNIFIIAEQTSYIYFDLNLGDVTISDTSYSGKILNVSTDENGTEVYETITVSGTHSSENRYYVYQTNSLKTKEYERIGKLESEITEVVNYAEEWEDKAKALGRESTQNRINITATGNSNKTTIDLTIDNIWSSYQSGAQGGLNIIKAYKSTYGVDVTLKLVGDSRMHCLRYNSYYKNRNSLTITSNDGDGNYNGSLTVVGNQTHQSGSSYYSITPYNHWDSVIGGTDSEDACYGLIINGGTIYSGATKYENCTAIGGGGNGIGQVTINGGKVMAITSSTGTAIGGGIAHTGTGGSSDILITGGEVYAYNFGQAYAETLSATGQSNMYSTCSQYVDFVPGTAIGGGSSVQQAGSEGKVKITGGKVYAESVGGSGIGGGNTIQKSGGVANITIEGGEVISRSVAGKLENIQTNRSDNYYISELIIPSGMGIGGGSSDKSAGGKGTVVIKNGKVTSNGIGGGNSTLSTGGDADVTINGGTISADTIGGGYSETLGYADGKVVVTGGSVNTTMAAVPTNGSEMVFLTRVALYADDNICINQQIQSLKGTNLGDYATSNGGFAKAFSGVYTDEYGMLYLFLPANSSISGCVDVSSGTYEALEEADGQIGVTEIGKLMYNGNKEHCMINVVSADYYNLYTDEERLHSFSGVRFVDKFTTFTFYIEANKDEEGNYYQVTPYYAVQDSNGNKTFKQGLVNVLSDGFYSVTINASSDLQVWFEIIAGDKKYFTLDLTNGDINITEDVNGTYSIEQNDYVYNGYNGYIYLTSGGYPTSNQITIDAGERTIPILANKIVVSSSESPMVIKSGTVKLYSTPSDDYIISSGSSAITVEEDATLIVESIDDASIKIYGANNYSAISGKGTVIIEDGGGFVVLNDSKNTSVPQLSVGIYEYISSVEGKMPYTAELYIGTFKFKLIGYIKGDTNTLYSVDVKLDENYENFSARGISERYNGVTSTNGYVQDGNYYLTLNSDTGSVLQDPSLQINDVVLEMGVDYSWVNNGNTGQLIIYGSAFSKGNITIFAAEHGLIPYSSLDYEGVYDEEYHSITVSVSNPSRFVIYYSDQTSLDESNYSIDGTTICPTYIDACEATVYWYIVDINEEYASVIGSNKCIILKTNNAWNNNLSCLDVVLGNSPNPSVSSKWGTPYYLYYVKNGDAYTQVDNIINQPVGTYYVKAFVLENDNYYALETSYYIRFKIFETNVFASTKGTFEKVNESSLNISIPLNGEFTVYYQVSATNDMKIEFSSSSNTYYALEEGTKITLIDFSDQLEIIRFYYYEITELDLIRDDKKVIISLDKFELMGNENAYFSLKSGVEANLQFIVEFPNDYQNMEMLIIRLLNESDNSMFNSQFDLKVSKFASTYEQIELKQVDSTNTSNIGIDFYLEVKSDEINTKILTVNLYDSFNNQVTFNDVMIKLNDGTSPTSVIGNAAIFNLGKGSMNKNAYSLTINGLSSGVYKVEVHIRSINLDLYDYQYSLSNISATNHLIIEDIEVIKSNKIQMVIEEINGIRIIEQSSCQLNFKVLTNGDISQIEIYICKKNLDGYGEYSSITHQINNQTLSLNLNGLSDGTYRIMFVQGDVVIYYNIIVDINSM